MQVLTWFALTITKSLLKVSSIGRVDSAVASHARVNSSERGFDSAFGQTLIVTRILSLARIDGYVVHDK